jgi:ribonuclease E
MFNPVVQLKSGGYIVIGVTEALVAIDVNSGRATKEGSIEETALKTNVEAAEEIARQLRLRDLAGLIVIDFIDMEERRNNATVEKRLKDKLKTDRARIQVGRISGFGLLEMSRQRLRPGMLESTTQPCPHCHGTGLIRSDDSMALTVLRALEEEGTRKRSREVLLKAPVGIVNYLFNQKREHVAMIEARYGMSVRIEADPMMVSPDYSIEKFKTALRVVPETPVVSGHAGLMGAPVAEEEEDEDIVDDLVEEEVEEASEAAPTAPAGEGDGQPGRKKRRRRRRRRGGPRDGAATGAEAGADEDGEDDGEEDEAETEASVVTEAAEVAPVEDAPAAKPKRTRKPRGAKAEAVAEATPVVEAAPVVESCARAGCGRRRGRAGRRGEARAEETGEPGEGGGTRGCGRSRGRGCGRTGGEACARAGFAGESCGRAGGGSRSSRWRRLRSRPVLVPDPGMMPVAETVVADPPQLRHPNRRRTNRPSRSARAGGRSGAEADRSKVCGAVGISAAPLFRGLEPRRIRWSVAGPSACDPR